MLISINDFNVYLLLFTASSLISARFSNTCLWFLGGYNSAIKKRGGKECKQCIKNNSIFRIPKLWNALPSSTRCLTSVKQFKLLLHKRYFNALQTSFNVDNPNTWKSVCTKCCVQRDILSSKICCY